MNNRVLLASAVAVLLAFSGSAADAATKPKPKPKPPPPLCNLIVSPSGNTPSVLTKDGNGGLRLVLDAAHQPTPYKAPPGYDAALDIISADIASSASTIVVVFRVASLSGAPLTAPSGRNYNFGWSWLSSGVGANIAADITSKGAVAGPSVGGTVVVDKTRNEIRVTQPIDKLQGHPLLPPGERMTNLYVTTDLSLNGTAVSGAIGVAGETARSAKSYPHLARSCVQVGR